ncbi:zinc ribbon domain-containing protein [Acetivibrio clariflavus]|uniref:Zinc-ribbon domain-containing protein n=1 Tax=Acetivibrio clariflavus (strain DSM 19732 / NBRC 101661 / EBR45) TaxID=720554 RepID=G8LXW5_ACECE|nr:zinc ribbon domain-containing protein [Acetivibrio clariflavus]AEV68868.1 hypothetical protein Clocl_2281 [Acetivibrio clariflavus DSM 19732]
MNNFGEEKAVCNFCGEEISPDAKRCPYCGSILSRERNLSNDEVKNDGFYDDGSTTESTSSYNSKGLSDNYINTDISAKDFINEEKINDEMNKGGLFDANDNTLGEEKMNVQAKAEGFIESGTQMPQQEQIAVQRPAVNNNIRPQRPTMINTPAVRAYEKPSLSNAMKVFLTSVSNAIPGLGQLVGVITAIVFMNSEGDTDKRSFGVALMVNSIIVFVIWAIFCCVVGLLIPGNSGI